MNYAQKDTMFIVAGIQTSLGYFHKHIPEDKIDKFISNVCQKGLVSFGIPLTSGKKDGRINWTSYINSVKKLLDPYLKVQNVMDMFLDSGGFQVTMGYIPVKQIPGFTEKYFEFLNNHKNLYDYAFSLDIPVLLKNCSKEDIYDLNKRSYNLIDSLDRDVAERIYFVSHFRLSWINKIWNKLIFEDGIIQKYRKFSIGGLVASQPAAKSMYFNLYTLGILQIILGFDYKVPDPFYFHILGSATATNIIYFTLLEKLFSDLLGVKSYVTFDSSAVFTKVQRARTFSYFDKNTKSCYNMDIRSLELDNRHTKCGITSRQAILNVIEEICEKCDIENPRKIIGNSIYTSDDGTFHEEIRPFILALESYELNEITKYCREYSEYLYDIYKNDKLKFTMELENLFIRLNGDKISNTFSQKSASIVTSLDTITEYVQKRKSVGDLLKYFKSLDTLLDSEESVDYTEQFNIFNM